jgi:hypothetical protein
MHGTNDDDDRLAIALGHPLPEDGAAVLGGWEAEKQRMIGILKDILAYEGIDPGKGDYTAQGWIPRGSTPGGDHYIMWSEYKPEDWKPEAAQEDASGN